LEKATIARDGDLTLEFMYLSDYVSDAPWSLVNETKSLLRIYGT
jgi:hypothetical protein